MRRRLCRVFVWKRGGSRSVTVNLVNTPGSEVRALLEREILGADLGESVGACVFLGEHDSVRWIHASPTRRRFMAGKSWPKGETAKTVADAVANMVCEKRFGRTAIQMEQEAAKGRVA